MIERSFARLKNRFPIMKVGAPYLSFSVHVKLVQACVLLHNYIAVDGDFGEDFIECATNIEGGDAAEPEDDDIPDEPDDCQAWKLYRDHLAFTMWADYIGRDCA